MFNRYAYAANDPVNATDSDGRILGLIGKGVKLIVKGGDVGATVAGAVNDAKAVFAPAGTSTRVARALAAASLASEIASPVSGRDAKAGVDFAGGAYKNLTGKGSRGLECHHCPSNSASPLSKGDGPVTCPRFFGPRLAWNTMLLRWNENSSEPCYPLLCYTNCCTIRYVRII